MRMATQRMAGGMLPALAALALLAGALAARHPLEQTMVHHMLIQIPMLVGGGALAGLWLLRGAAGGLGRRLAAWNENGLAGLTAFLLVSACWMIPRALDAAVATPAVEHAKVLSLVAAGMLLPASLAAANTIIQVFFLGNFASMTAIVGMLYQDAPSRLCNAYLQNDQQDAGVGLVVLAVAVPLLWCMARGVGGARR